MYSIVAITGLDGHPYGSWRKKDPPRRMWLQSYLSQDLPTCRTMTYGYNSKISAYKVDTVMDFGRALMEELKLVRKSTEVCQGLAPP